MNVLEQCWSSFPDTMSIILVLTSCAFRLGGLIAEFLDSHFEVCDVITCEARVPTKWGSGQRRTYPSFLCG